MELALRVSPYLQHLDHQLGVKLGHAIRQLQVRRDPPQSLPSDGLSQAEHVDQRALLLQPWLDLLEEIV
eukprot:12169508-Alexandrium_andersonii.AAC.1